VGFGAAWVDAFKNPILQSTGKTIKTIRDVQNDIKQINKDAAHDLSTEFPVFTGANPAGSKMVILRALGFN
jgi:hypothetical protein